MAHNISYCFHLFMSFCRYATPVLPYAFIRLSCCGMQSVFCYWITSNLYTLAQSSGPPPLPPAPGRTLSKTTSACLEVVFANLSLDMRSPCSVLFALHLLPLHCSTPRSSTPDCRLGQSGEGREEGGGGVDDQGSRYTPNPIPPSPVK